MAGDPNGSPADSPANRVDANTATSPFAGVGSVEVTTTSGTYLGTGTAIDPFHVLTAAHMVDLDGNGVSDANITSVKFNLNLDVDTPTDMVDASIPATSWQIHPDFTGFNNPSMNDDLAVLTLGGGGIPAGVPTYGLATSDMVVGQTHLYIVGYGWSGDGVSGYNVFPSWTVKRHGKNIVDYLGKQDDRRRPKANETFGFDFDGPTGNGLGNAKETMLGGGDSGGPSLILVGDPSLASSYLIAGVNTAATQTQGKFGSWAYGINVFPYRDWILGPHPTSTTVTGGTSQPTVSAALGEALFLTLAMTTTAPANGGLPTSSVSPPILGSVSAFAPSTLGPSFDCAARADSCAPAAIDNDRLDWAPGLAPAQSSDVSAESTSADKSAAALDLFWADHADTLPQLDRN